MDQSAVEIIVPVWNNPVDTRNCLASLVKYSPDARFILMDNGSNRETEAMLQDFADILDKRALLLRSDITQEYVRVVNRGLARAEAPVSIVVKNTTTVSDGWLQPILEFVSGRPDVGVVVPNLVEKKGRLPARKKIAVKPPIEISHGSFAAIMVTKSLYEKIGGFDEGLDGRLWCLKDYSRRAWQAGFLTFRVAGAPVYYKKDILYGSLTRRAEMMQKSIAEFTDRWGVGRAYCIELTKDVCPESLGVKFAFLLDEARLGHSFTVLAHKKVYRVIVKCGYHLMHKNIVVERLPTLFAAHTVKNHISRLHEIIPNVRVLTDSEDLFSIKTT
jgi:glycosyltransferase involved in cell wall biosynthesis